MPTVYLDSGSQSLFEPGYGSVLIINNDLTRIIYIGPNTTVNVTDTPIAPQASITLDGAIRYYGSILSTPGTAEALVIPGGGSYSLGTPSMSTVEAVANTSAADVYTFTAAGRIWGALLTLALGSTSGYSSGFFAANVYAYFNNGSGAQALVACDVCVTGPSQASSVTAQAVIPGLSMPAATRVGIAFPELDPDVSAQSSFILYYSVP